MYRQTIILNINANGNAIEFGTEARGPCGGVMGEQALTYTASRDDVALALGRTLLLVIGALHEDMAERFLCLRPPVPVFDPRPMTPEVAERWHLLQEEKSKMAQELIDMEDKHDPDD